MPELTKIEEAEIAEAELKKLMPEVEKLMPDANETEVKKWVRLTTASDEQITALAKETKRRQKAKRDALWESLGKEK